MQKCENCGNESLSDESNFCDKCGSYIKLSNKEIQFKKEKYNSIKLLEKTLIEGVKLINKDIKETATRTFDILLYRDLIISYLMETTNIKDKLQYMSEDNFFNQLLTLLKKLNYSDENILNEFLTEINEIYENTKHDPKSEIKFIFYTNIKLRDSQKDKFQELLDFFDLKIFNYSNYNFQRENSDIEIFNSEFLLLSYITKGKDYTFMYNQAMKKINIFFGYLTYLANSFKTLERYNVNQFTLKHNIADLYITSVVELDLSNSFIDYEFSHGVIGASKKLKKSKLPEFNNNFLLYDFYKCLVDSNNKFIVKKIFEYFSFYYLATLEEDLNLSAIKFWTLSEKIIKDIGNEMPDKNLRKYMQKILKLYKYPKYIQNRILHIQDKRNKFIHENIMDFNQNDRNIIKLVADNLIMFVIELNEIVTNMQEYKIILDYFNQDNNKRTIELLKYIENIKK